MKTLASVLFLALASLTQAGVNQQPISEPPTSACQSACNDLSSSLPKQVFFGASAEQPLWSLHQAEVSPRCVVQPLSAPEVAFALSIVVKYGCQFAILGGGTSPFKGASNSEGGITLDLFSLREVSFVGDEEKEIKVGGGAIWADVYRVLDPRNMSAAGTRNSLTGVAGSILGGGISFYSHQHGWSCDTVTSFEVVLANSTIVNATENSHPDLFWALKGGGNNFGIVTSLTLTIFPQTPSWYIYRRWDMSLLESVLQYMVDTTASFPKDMTMLATTLAWFTPVQRFVIGERLVASEETPALPKAADGSDLSFIEGYTDLRTTLEMAQKMDSFNREGYYNYFGSTTVKSNVGVLMEIGAIFQEEVAKIVDVADLQVYIVYNPVTVESIRHMQRHGGNALGLMATDGPLNIVNTNLHWAKSSDTPRLQHFMRQLSIRFRQAAKDLDQYHPYVFQNHAFEDEDPFPGYGEINMKQLHRIRSEVDPEAIFQKLQPGFFKLGTGDKEQITRPDIKSEL